MGAITVVPGARTLIAGSGAALDSLASATYVSAGVIDVTAIDPIELVIEVEVTPGAVSSFRQVSVFLQVSFDGTNYSTGPDSGSASTSEPNLRFIGYLPLNSSSTFQRGSFPVASALGFVPPYCKVICKNETGSALASGGNAVYYTTFTGNTA